MTSFPASLFRCTTRLLVFAVAAVFPFAGCTKQAKLHRALERGKQYLQEGELEKAKITYLGVLRSDPQNAESIKQIGLIFWDEGIPMETARFLIKARDLIPADPAVHLKLALALRALQHIPEARKEAEAVLEREPEQPDALLLLVETARSEEELMAAQERLGKLDRSKPGPLLAEAIMALRNRNTYAATRAVEKALAADPKLSLAHSAKGTLALQKKDLAAAEEAFRQAAELAPRSSATLTYAGLLLQRDAGAGAAYLEAVSQKVPEFVPLCIYRARMALGERKPEQAEALLKQIFQIDSSNFDALLLQGQLHISKGETDKAIDLYKKLSESEIYGRVPLPKFELARAYVLKANPSQAITVLNEAIKLQPDYREAVLLLAQLKLQMGDPQPVVSSMKALLEKAPNLLSAQLLLSQAYRSQGNLTDAARVLREQLEVTPDASEPHLLLGLIMFQAGKPAEARESFLAVRKLAPKNLLAAYHLVELDLSDQKFTQAQETAQSLLREMPGTPGPFFVMARVHAAQEHWSEAEEALKKCIELDANFTSAYDLLVGIYMKRNQLEAASAQTEAFLSRNPENLGALLILANIQERLENFEKARLTYQKVIDANPNSAAALNNLAVIQADHFHEFDKAYELASRARSLQPDDGHIADTLGWIAYRRNDAQQALALLQEADGKIPSNAEVQYHLGMAAYMNGQVELARANLEKAAAAPEDFPGKSEISRSLAMLGAGSGSAVAISEADLQAALRQNPNDLIVRQKLSDLLEKKDAFPQAAALWEEALKNNPKLLTAALKLAQLNGGHLQNAAKAFEYAKRARALAPGDSAVARVTGQVAYQSGNYAWAYNVLQEVSLQSGADSHLLHDFAWTAYYLGKVEEARQAMQRALTAKAEAFDAEAAQQFLALTALEGKPEEIAPHEGEIQAALKQKPDNVPALMLKAALSLQQNQPAEATRIYSSILARLPDFAPAQKRLAALYLEKPEQAAAAFDLATKARKTLPDDPEVAQTLAALRYQRKEYPSVVQLLQESAASRPLDAKSLFYLGMSRLQVRQKPEGYAALDEALAKGLPPAETAEATKALAHRDEKEKQ